MHINASGDTAIIVEFGNEVNRELSNLVLSAEAAVTDAAIIGVIETLPSFRSLLVQYDPLVTTAKQVIGTLTPLMSSLSAREAKARTWHLPVCYDEEYAPDIANVASLTGHTIDQVAKIHSDVLYHVYMLGFLPGLPYMGDLPEVLHLPRRVNPRTRVPRGSVSIATSLSTIYPYESPGGWHLIGTTPLDLFDVNQSPPAIFSPGDKVKFEPVSKSDFVNISQQVSAGQYKLAPTVTTR